MITEKVIFKTREQCKQRHREKPNYAWNVWGRVNGLVSLEEGAGIGVCNK